MPMLFRIEARVAAAARATAVIGLAMVACMAIVTLADVALRALLGRTIPGLTDLMDSVYLVGIAACFPAMLSRRANIRVNLLDPVLGAMGKRMLDALGHAATAVILCLLAWQLAAVGTNHVNAHRVGMILGLPTAPSRYLGAALLAGACLVETLQFFIALVRGHAAESASLESTAVADGEPT